MRRHHTFAKSGLLNRFLAIPLFGRQGTGTFLIGISVLLIFISGIRPDLFETPRSMIRTFVMPVLSVFGTPFIVMTNGLDYVYKISILQQEVADLKSKNAKLEEWYNIAQVLQAENTSLKDLLQVKVGPGFKTVTSRVIADIGGAYAQGILIDGGADAGLFKGDIVLAGQGVLGRIVSADTKTAEVLLLTDVNSRIPVRIDGTAVQGIAGGTTDGQLILDRLPDGQQVRTGMRIVTSGSGGLFPPDLPLGVIEVQPQTGDARIKPFADMSRLIYVRVLLPDALQMTP